MLKRALLTVMVTLTLMASQVQANDLLADVQNLDVSGIQDAQLAIEVDGLAGVNVDALASQADSSKSDEAIEACFRRMGYCNYGCYYPCYYSCYRPCVPWFSYYPVYHYVACPVYTCYWGCY